MVKDETVMLSVAMSISGALRLKFSLFGERLGGRSAIRELMEDLGAALAGGREVCMLGGGNPAHIPAVEERLRRRWREVAEDPVAFARMIGDYDEPQANADSSGRWPICSVARRDGGSARATS